MLSRLSQLLVPKSKPSINPKQLFKRNYIPRQQQYNRFQNRTSEETKKSYKLLAIGGGLFVTGYVATHLERVPISERLRFMNITPEEERQMGEMGYNEIMKQYSGKIINSGSTLDYVRQVARDIIKVADLPDLDWEVYLVHDDTPNAFVLPGGKVFVFTGILKVADNKNALAVILGHEIAHQFARHSAEKMAFNKLVFYFTLLLSLVFDPTFINNRLFLDFGLFLPFSRRCETEADEIGLILSSKACYDPRESLRVWKRMQEHDSLIAKLDFLSTHPSSGKRMERLEKFMPKAMEVYNKGECEDYRYSIDNLKRMRWI